MKELLTVVTRKGQVTVPAEVRKALALKQGDKVAFELPESATGTVAIRRVGSVVEQTPLGKLAEVGDIADAAVFLCSNEARFITGIGLPVDGGMGR